MVPSAGLEVQNSVVDVGIKRDSAAKRYKFVWRTASLSGRGAVNKEASIFVVFHRKVTKQQQLLQQNNDRNALQIKFQWIYLQAKFYKEQ